MLSFIGALIILMLTLLLFFFVKTSLDAKEANQKEAEMRSIDYCIPHSPVNTLIKEHIRIIEPI